MLYLFLHFLGPACAVALVPTFFLPLLAACFAPADTRRAFGQNMVRALLFALKVGLPIALLLAGFGAWWITAHMSTPDSTAPAPVFHKLS
jgi:hypothetical protein